METIYIPPHHRERDVNVIHDFMDEFSFATVVSATPDLRASHVPVLLDRHIQPFGRLLGHLARNNPQLAAFDGKQQTMILFQGPHAYVSPSWYVSKQNVPTWNYAAVHASGRARAVDDAAELESFLAQLTTRHETFEGTGWTMDGLAENYRTKMLRGAVLFVMDIESLEAKFKLGAERSVEDKAGMIAGLRASRGGQALAGFLEANLRRTGKL